MIWAHVASGNVASKTGGISFNLVFLFFSARMCVCMATQAAAFPSILKRTLICLLTPVMELYCQLKVILPHLQESNNSQVPHIKCIFFYMLHQCI